MSGQPGGDKINEGYLLSYAEIPDARIEDTYLAAKKLGGHRRLFDPQDNEGLKAWVIGNLPQLVRAYPESLLGTILTELGINDTG